LTMKHFFTISLCFLALSLSAQTTSIIDVNKVVQIVNDEPQTSYQGSWSNGFVTNGELLRESPNNTWTFAVWINLNPDFDSNNSIIGTGLWWGNGYRLWVNNNTLHSYFFDETDGGSVRESGVIPSAQWTHIAVTHDGVQRKHYVNGVLVNLWNEPYSFEFSTSNGVGIGWAASNWAQTYNGLIDDLSIFHLALTEEQINGHMHCPETEYNTSLVAFWDFEGESSEEFYADKSGNNHSLSPINSPIVLEGELLSFCGCMDSEACNYDITALEDNGTCVFISEGDCDCNGNVLDECDVCGGNNECCPGPGCCSIGHYWDWELEQCFDINPTDTNLDGCTNLTDLMDILSAYGDCSAPAFTCGNDIEHEGDSYSTVQIGDQCWFSENCRYLPEVSPSSEGSETEPYYYVYGYEGTDIEAAKSTSNYETYGVLYNWPAVMTDEICPSGWNIPTISEYWSLVDLLGGDYVAGDLLKDDVLWNGSNETGFSGLPSGERYYTGEFDHFNEHGHFWASSIYEFASSIGQALELRDAPNGQEVGTTANNSSSGFSARCIKD